MPEEGPTRASSIILHSLSPTTGIGLHQSDSGAFHRIAGVERDLKKSSGSNPPPKQVP